MSNFIFDILAVKLSSEEMTSRDVECWTVNHISYIKMNKVSICFNFVAIVALSLQYNVIFPNNLPGKLKQ